jgi:hypothetical protein
VTDAGLKSLEKIPTFEVLLIGESMITGEGTKAIQNTLPKIKFSEQTQ